MFETKCEGVLKQLLKGHSCQKLLHEPRPLGPRALAFIAVTRCLEVPPDQCIIVLIDLVKMQTRTKLLLGGMVTYTAAVFVGYQYSQATKPSVDSINGENVDPKNISLPDSLRIPLFNKHARSYDSDIGFDEFLMGVNLLRRWHLRKARGNVLEVGCGTGRNFDYYTSNVNRVIAIDAAEEMIQQSKQKISNKKNITVHLMNAHAIEYSNESFDTVVDTFGLCSYQNPIAVLNEMKRVCRRDGRILLIEHGKGSYNWINNQLDMGACRHANNWGCIWNRDIIDIVKQADLKIISVSRFHFGTTYLIEAQPQHQPLT